jgi:hypothetical protein
MKPASTSAKGLRGGGGGSVFRSSLALAASDDRLSGEVLFSAQEYEGDGDGSLTISSSVAVSEAVTTTEGG